MKISKKLLLVLSSVTLLSGCGQTKEEGGQPCPDCPECSQCPTCPECTIPHEHTFDTEHWKNDETKHWHEATCEHKELASSLAAHNFGDDNVCDACGYELPPVPEKYFDFNFVGTHCSLNNESTYKEGSEVLLTLTVDEQYHLPDSINIVGSDDFVFSKENKTISLTVNNNITVIVNAVENEKPEPTKYVVSFNSNGGSDINPITVVEGETFIKPEDPVKENKTFLGWYEKSDFSGERYVFGTRVNKDITLYASWGVVITYVNYDGSTILNSTIKEGFTAEKPQNPEYFNAHFDGWYDNADFVGDEFDFEKSITENTRLYAKFYYLATFLGNDKSVFKTEKVQVGDRLAKPEDPTKEYHDFESWYFDEEHAEEFEFNNVLTQDVILYSNFTPKKYNINYIGAEGLIHSNPSTYIYGVGVEEFVDPTKDSLDKQFYGWYLDSDFSKPATTIEVDAHEEVNIYAKRADKYNITYVNWPTNVENLNPKTYTKYDQVIFDIDDIKANPGYLSPSFKVDGESVPGIGEGSTGDVEVEIIYDLKQTTLTLDPNKGDFLPDKTSIYVNFGIADMDPVCVEVPTIKEEYGINLFDPKVLTIPQKEGYVIEGFSKSSLARIPLSEEEINDLPNGSTIYAIWEPTNGKHPIPFSIEEIDCKVMSAFNFVIPNNISEISIDFLSTEVKRGNMEIYGHSGGQSYMFHTTSFTGDIDMKDYRIQMETEYDSYELIYTYNVEEGHPNPSFSISIKPSDYKSLEVRATGNSEPVNQSILYTETFSISDPARVDHEFVGWFDASGNKYEVGEAWSSTADNVTLYAHYKYNHIQDEINKFNVEYKLYESQLVKSKLEYLSSSQIEKYNTQLYEAYVEGLKLFEADLDKEETLDLYQNVVNSLARIYYRASEENLELCKADRNNHIESLAQAFIDLLPSPPEEYIKGIRNIMLDTEQQIGFATSIEKVTECHDRGADQMYLLYKLYAG